MPPTADGSSPSAPAWNAQTTISQVVLELLELAVEMNHHNHELHRYSPVRVRTGCDQWQELRQGRQEWEGVLGTFECCTVWILTGPQLERIINTMHTK